MWTFPSTTRAAPELLLQDFVDLTGIVPATIRCDNEFGENQSLLRWAMKFGATVCPTPAYNHTMAARIEESVCIVKEHLLVEPVPGPAADVQRVILSNSLAGSRVSDVY
eukprot:1018800-Rhodomonas_salina.1